MKKDITGLEIRWNRLREVLEEYASFFVKEAQQNIQGYGAIATGNLIDGIKPADIVIENEGESTTIKVNVLLEEYWKFIEGGTKGKESSPAGAKFKAHRPPVPAIMDWIDVKGLSKGNERDDLGFAIAISKSIEKRGIPPKPFFKEAKETTYEAFENRIMNAIREDLDEYVEDVLMYYYNILMGL